MAKVLVICARRYNGHELWGLLKRLRVHDHSFEVVSSATIIRDELSMQPNTINRTFYDFDPGREIPPFNGVGGRERLGLGGPQAENPIDSVPSSESSGFDGVCVVSGNMSDTEAYWTNDKIIEILKAFKVKRKVIAAICCSVPTLAPICEGVRVSPFPLVRNRQRLQRYGAILDPVSVCVDMEHRIVTAENQMMTYPWGNAIAALLDGKEPELTFSQTRFAESFKGTTPRRLPKAVEEQLRKFRPTPATIKKGKEP